MPYLAYPTLPSEALPDSAKFSIELEDNTVSHEMEGAYTVTRPRSTRRKRKTFSITYTFISEADRAAIETHYQAVAGGAEIFEWISPEDDLMYLVRFKGPLTFTYRGRGDHKRWDCSFELQQA
jgi:hypothetical protein